MEWLCLEARLTAFTEKPFTNFGSGFWQHITKSAPDIQTMKPKISLLHEEGIFLDNKLFIDIDPIRLNYLYSANYKNTPESEQINTIGDIDLAIASFKDLSKNIFSYEHFPEIKRLAFGASLLYNVDNAKEGYKILAELLDDTLKLDIDKSSDFLYQINRPIDLQIGTESISINRLRKWSVARYSFLPISFGGDASFTLPGNDLFATRLELDINTSAKRSEKLDKDIINNLFEELISQGTLVANVGDC